MNTVVPESERKASRDAAHWARPFAKLSVTHVPAGAINLNVDGRPVSGPLQGFGPLWQKTYQVRLSESSATPTEVIRVWKEHFPEFQPPLNYFYPSIAGVEPGEVVLLNAAVGGLPVYAGVVVIHSDETSFTLMTPRGIPEAGWIICSAYDENGTTVAQVQTMARSADPIYEIGFRLVGSRAQEQIWSHVLTSLASRFGVVGQVQTHVICIDPNFQWSEAKNIWHNAMLRSFAYRLAAPVRWVRTLKRKTAS